MSDKIDLVLHPPRLYNSIRMLICIVICLPMIYISYKLNLITPVNEANKIFLVAGFTINIILLISSFGTAICSFLNIISAPTVRITDNKIAVLNRPAIYFTDIASCKITSKKSLSIISKDGSESIIKQHFINIPISSLMYALELRIHN